MHTGAIWVHVRADGSREHAVMGCSQEVSAQVTKHFVTISSKTCNNVKILFCFLGISTTSESIVVSQHIYSPLAHYP